MNTDISIRLVIDTGTYNLSEIIPSHEAINSHIS